MNLRSTRWVRIIGLLTLALAIPIRVLPAAVPATRGGPGFAAAPVAGGFENAERPWAFSFPRDHAAHFGFATEWWYYTGHLSAADGRQFGYELTFFRIGIRPGDPRPAAGQSGWRGNQLYMGHFALTDQTAKSFMHVERFAREALGAGSSSDRALDVRVNDWTLAGTNPFRMHAAAGNAALTLVQISEKPPAIHGHAGISVKAACSSCASHYYSMTRLRSSGTLVVNGQRLAVTGLSWMDHEFGSGELQSNQAGWDWFSVQLDDRRELMLYRLRQKDGSITPQSSGSLIDAAGRVTHLALSDFSTEALGRWTSPHTGGVYPSGWRVRVPGAGIDVTLAPTVADQELANGGGVSYWEGAVSVLDSRTQRPAGVGYVELTGYAGAISL